MIDYLISRYGENRVCQIINFSFITPTVAIRDVGKVLGFKYREMDAIAKKFSYETFDECLKKNPDIAEASQYKELLAIASKLSGRVKTVSAHAGGVGIVDTDITDYMAMKLGSKGEHVISVDKRVVEEIGIIKFDILGVQTLSVLQEIQQDLNISDWEININNPEFENNRSSYKLLKTAKTNGVFQVESAGMKELLIRLSVSNLSELSAVLALYRPDAMGALEEYIACKHDPSKVKYVHPDMKPILEETYGCMIYQEQLMDIVRKFGGRSYGGGDKFRKAIGKKDRELIVQESSKLYQEIIDNGYSENLAEIISNNLSTKGSYLFNKSHSVSYAVLTLQTAYLKANYPAHFFKALFNINKTKPGALNKYILDARDFNISILPPNINHSGINFTVSDGSILFGLSAIAGIGENVASRIVTERDANGKFKNIDDLLSRVNLTKSQVIALIKSGAIPCKNKKQMVANYLTQQYKPADFKPPQTLPVYKTLIAKYGIDKEQYRIGSGKNDYDKAAMLAKYTEIKKAEYDSTIEQRLEKFNKDNNKYLENEEFWEFESLQVFIEDNPFAEADKYIHKPYIDTEPDDTCVVIGVISKVQKKKDRNSNQYAFINIYTSYGLIEGVVWASDYAKHESIINKGSQVAVYGTKTNDGGIVICNMKTFDQWCKDRKIKR